MRQRTVLALLDLFQGLILPMQVARYHVSGYLAACLVSAVCTDLYQDALREGLHSHLYCSHMLLNLSMR